MARLDRDERPRQLGGLSLIAVGVFAGAVGIYLLVTGDPNGNAIPVFLIGAFFGGAGVYLIWFLGQWRVNSISVDAEGFAVRRPSGRWTKLSWSDPTIDFYLNDASNYQGPLGTHPVPGKFSLMSARSKIGKISVPEPCYTALMERATSQGLRIERHAYDPASPFFGLLEHHLTRASGPQAGPR